MWVVLPGPAAPLSYPNTQGHSAGPNTTEKEEDLGNHADYPFPDADYQSIKKGIVYEEVTH